MHRVRLDFSVDSIVMFTIGLYAYSMDDRPHRVEKSRNIYIRRRRRAYPSLRCLWPDEAVGDSAPFVRACTLCSLRTGGRPLSLYSALMRWATIEGEASHRTKREGTSRVRVVSDQRELVR